MTKDEQRIRDRIQELRRVPARQLRPHPRNWRTHPQQQREALRGVLAEIGYADALLARQLPDGTLELIDGHLRAETTPDMEVPVLVLDLTEAEAAKLLAVHDPLGALAGADDDAVARLLDEVDTGNEALRKLLDDWQDRSSGEDPVELRPIPVRRPPRMTWVLIGLPTVRFGEIAETIESLAGIEGILVESTVCDGEEDRQLEPEG